MWCRRGESESSCVSKTPDAQNARYAKIAPNWNVTGTRNCSLYIRYVPRGAEKTIHRRGCGKLRQWRRQPFATSHNLTSREQSLSSQPCSRRGYPVITSAIRPAQSPPWSRNTEWRMPGGSCMYSLHAVAQIHQHLVSFVDANESDARIFEIQDHVRGPGHHHRKHQHVHPATLFASPHTVASKQR